MSRSRPRVAVVGAGILGSSIAFHLARNGHAVTILDANPRPARGVTAHAFGWINLIIGRPREASADARQREAVEDFARLERALPHAFRDARRGSLVWEADAQQTEALISAHPDRGTTVERVDANAIRRLEPRLKSPPPVAAHSPDDIALEPSRLAACLLDAAIEAGATARFGEVVSGIIETNGRVTGVTAPTGQIEADVVVSWQRERPPARWSGHLAWRRRSNRHPSCFFATHRCARS